MTRPRGANPNARQGNRGEAVPELLIRRDLLEPEITYPRSGSEQAIACAVASLPLARPRRARCGRCMADGRRACPCAGLADNHRPAPLYVSAL